jgi:LysM repeat protein
MEQQRRERQPPGTASDAPVAPPTIVPLEPAAPPSAPVADSTVPAPATDAPPTAPDSSDATSAEDPSTGVAPDGSFGQNGRKMVLSSDGTQGTYTVQPGDSLWTIAEDKLGVGDAANDPTFQARVANLVAQLTSDNNITNPDLILPGQQLTFTNLQNSAYDSSSSDASSLPSSGTDASSTDAQTPAPQGPVDGTSYQPGNQDLTPPVPSSDEGSDNDTDDNGD